MSLIYQLLKNKKRSIIKKIKKGLLIDRSFFILFFGGDSLIVSELITRAKLFRPTSETDANLLKLIDMAHKEIYLDLNDLKQAFNDFSTYEDLTVSSQVSYDMPSYCDYNNIQRVLVSTVTYDLVTAYTDWDEFDYVGINDSQDESTGNIWGKYDTTNNKYFLLSNGIPISQSNLRIKLLYYPKPIDITSTSQTLEVDDKYSSLYLYKLLKFMCLRGHNPDIVLQNGYDSEYQALLLKVKSDLHDKYMSNPDLITQKEEYM